MSGFVDGALRRLWLLGVPLGLVGAAVVIGFARPWDHPSVPPQEVRVDQATLRPGQIVLVVVNDSEEISRVAQVILNDAFVDFRQSQRSLKPGDAERITVSYPWIAGEAYEVRLMTSKGATIDYEIEEAASGRRRPSSVRKLAGPGARSTPTDPLTVAVTDP